MNIAWVYSEEYGQVGQVIETQTLWGETTCRVWLPGRDSVVRIPASRLKPIESAGTGSPDNIAYITAAARVADALTRDVLLCLDMGHFHPTETIHDKLSSILSFKDEILLHVSRGIRWDSDHVVVLNDDVKNVFHELVRGGALDRVNVALDFFDASINRIGAWVIGTRATIKAILFALLEPSAGIQQMEQAGDLAGKLAMLEEMKTMPFGAVWDMYCLRQGVPAGPAWLNDMHAYDRDVLRKRGV